MVRTSSSRSRDRCSSMRSCISGSPKSSARRGRDWTPTAHVATLGESPRRGRRRRPGPHRHGRRFSSGDPPCCRTTSFRPKSRSDEAEARFPGPVALIDVHCAGCWVRDAGSNLFRIGSGNPPETCLICGHLVLVMRRADGQNTSCLQAESGVRSASLAACHAEGRGFESLQPLDMKALQIGGFFFARTALTGGDPAGATIRRYQNGGSRRWASPVAQLANFGSPAPMRQAPALSTTRNSARAAWLLAWKQQPECRPAGPRVLPYTRSGDNGQTREWARAFTGATWRREDQPSCVSTLVRLERVRRAVP